MLVTVAIESGRTTTLELEATSEHAAKRGESQPEAKHDEDSSDEPRFKSPGNGQRHDPLKHEGRNQMARENKWCRQRKLHVILLGNHVSSNARGPA